MKEDFSLQYLLKRNTINIFGVIDDNLAEMVISQIEFLVDNNAKEITLQINSPGGSVTAGLAIYDTLNYVDARIITVGLGLCASMGAFLLSSGSKGYRRATENCEIMIHQPLGGASGQASDIIIAAEHIKKTRERLNNILALNTSNSTDRIISDTDRDNIMSAKEALEYGLIDTVIPSRIKARGE